MLIYNPPTTNQSYSCTIQPTFTLIMLQAVELDLKTLVFRLRLFSYTVFMAAECKAIVFYRCNIFSFLFHQHR